MIELGVAQILFESSTNQMGQLLTTSTGLNANDRFFVAGRKMSTQVGYLSPLSRYVRLLTLSHPVCENSTGFFVQSKPKCAVTNSGKD